MGVLKKSDEEKAVRGLQKSLVLRGLPVEVGGTFDARTGRGVRAFPSQNPDQHGQLLGFGYVP